MSFHKKAVRRCQEGCRKSRTGLETKRCDSGNNLWRKEETPETRHMLIVAGRRQSHDASLLLNKSLARGKNWSGVGSRKDISGCRRSELPAIVWQSLMVALQPLEKNDNWRKKKGICRVCRHPCLVTASPVIRIGGENKSKTLKVWWTFFFFFFCSIHSLDRAPVKLISLGSKAL